MSLLTRMLKSIWFWLILPVVGLVALFVFALGYSWFVNRQIHENIAAIVAEWDQNDPGWRLEEIEASRKVLPPERNSALLVMQVKTLLGPGQLYKSEEYEAVFGTESLPPPAQLNEVQIKFLRDFLGKHEKTLALAAKLKDLPEGRYPITYTPDFFSTIIQNQRDCREIADLLRQRVLLQIQEKEIDQALESCQAIFNNGRSLGDEPLLISLLIRLAIRSIATHAVERACAQGEARAASLENLQKQLEVELKELPRIVLQAIKGERAGFFSLCRGLMNGQVSWTQLAEAARLGRQFAGGGKPAELEDLLTDLFPSVVNKYFPDFLRFAGQQVEMAKLPLEEQINAWEKQLPEIQGSNNLLAKLFLCGQVKVIGAAVRAKASLECARVGLACERFRLQKKAWPKDLQDLVEAKLLDAVPLDPFDGQPLRWRRTKDGLVIYSVSVDRTDNGGTVDRDNPTLPGNDLGFQLWDPSARRQPPLPPAHFRKDKEEVDQ